jgi:hypothetical protein
MGTFVETESSLTVYCLQPKSNKLPFSFSFAVYKRKFAVPVFHSEKTNGNCRFPSVSFSVYVNVETWRWRHGKMEKWRNGDLET